MKNDNTFLSFEDKAELANTITHGLGILLGLAILPVLGFKTNQQGTDYQLLGVIIFSFSWFLVYTASTVYHAVRNPKYHKVLKTIDHIAIYFLIAGTYTPFLLFYAPDEGIPLLIFQWSLVAIGIFFKLFFVYRFEWLSLVVYLIMGWSIIIMPGTFWEGMPDQVTFWLIAGGVSYTAGIIFYASKRIPYAHAIWHIFVLGGSICHYLALLKGL